MSIVISGLNKFYGKQLVLDNISLNIPQGTGVTGLLGPNGAGKSTMMKILSCLISPSSGTASVCDMDVVSRSGDVKKITGYLPENNPLYYDMYVQEYLAMTADIYKIGNKRKAIERVVERTGLGDEKKKKIGRLSKGYRQRVGLAQNLLHDPEVLILDEPTTGLDPNQISEIRDLIKEVGRDKTVILSSHIMQEVEALCDRVIIIHKGNITADDRTGSLRSGASGKTVEIEFAEKVSLDIFSDLAFINDASYDKNTGVFSFGGRNEEEDIRPLLFKTAVEKGLTVVSMTQKEHRLEDVFKRLTEK